jgi:hypothetical protein
VNTIDGTLAEVRAIAEKLVGGMVAVQHLQPRGRNSRIYRIDCGQQTYALKQYPSRSVDARDRLGTEVGALQLMERSRVDVVPRVVGVDRDRGCALLTWIDGAEIAELTKVDIEAAVHFISAIHALRKTPWASEQPIAAEACLSGREIERQLGERLSRLLSLPLKEWVEHDLAAFLENCFMPVRDRLLAKAKSDMTAAELDFAAELPQERRSLSPSDFGFHNSLRRPDGSLAFVDFEYFGWDDPVKLIADVTLHPGWPLTDDQRRCFLLLTLPVYQSDSKFAARFRALFPLFGLRWVLIVLNEFLPERWERRVLAGHTGLWREAKLRQLARAKNLLATLPRRLENESCNSG